ncbi:MAG: DNA methyltransferase [Clostridium sp.]|nr:DNA methyltransferase [Clostridium sp.]MDU7082926.1 DNA methyltransferase [Clostridium sp.]
MGLFSEETTSIWSFEERGDWATHKGDYPGNCSPRVVKNLIVKYTKENDVILDQFLGSGTTAIEALLLNRKIVGIDINHKALNIANRRLEIFKGNKDIKLGDAQNLDIKDKSIDFICTHPPYMDIIKYSKDIKDDLSLLGRKGFFIAINKVADECYRVLKSSCKCAIIMGDIRRRGYIEPLGFNVMNIFLSRGFLLKEIIIKEQHNCKSTEKWRQIAKERNFLLIQHEYIFVFEKSYFK